METKRHLMDNSNSEPIAIIGFGLKFPQQASSPSGFWNLLVQGDSARTVTPGDRYNADAFHRETAPGGRQRHGTIKTKHGHYLAEPLDRFDAPFFSITPHEAVCMDPQQRLLLEVTYHALENAGLSMDSVNGSNTSAYVGSFMNDYESMTHKDLDVPNSYHATGKASAILANRLSWFYNLKGPSVAVNTACSGSLVALHLACESLRTGETSMGLVCGSNLLLTPENTAGLSNLNFLSPDGICYAFDERANGYARGEGIACLVIKPLSAALRDHDPVRAVIRGTGVNSDGRTPGISQPSCDAQIQLIRKTYDRFGLKLDQTRYFEAHGTGTQVGDPIEAEAIATVFRPNHGGTQPMYIGALKSNLGQLEGASGVAAVIKTLMVLEKGVIPPNVWFERKNSSIKDEWGLFFPTSPVSWPDNGLRRASVNSFGFGGTNAHAVIDDARSFVETNGYTHQIPNGWSSQGVAKVMVLSAADEKAVTRVCEAYRSHLSARDEKEEDYKRDLAFTLSQRRSHFPWRSFFISDADQGFQNLEFSPAVQSNSKTQICFLFTGQGAQWATMGRELLSHKIFRQSLEDSDTLLRNIGCQFSVIDKLYTEDGYDLDRPEFCQPSCTALQIALVELLSSWGVQPFAVVGHSSGEVAAAYCAGLITKSYALKLAFFRGVSVSASCQINLQEGGMMAIRLSTEKTETILSSLAQSSNTQSSNVAIACYNSPNNLTLSGDKAQIDKLESELEAQGIMSRKLNVTVAYHNSKHMEPVASIYQSLITDSTVNKTKMMQSKRKPKCYMISSVRDKVFAPDSDGSEVSMHEYWVENLISPVRFTQGIQKLATILHDKIGGLANAHFVEVGPHCTLKSAVKESLSKDWNLEKSYSSMLARQQSADITALTVAGRLYCAGYPINLSAVNNQHPGSSGSRVLTDLPSYPFDHSKQYWLESRISRDYRFRKFPRHDFLGTPAADWNSLEPQWNNRFTLQEQPWIKDHQVSGAIVYPAAGMLVMAIEAARQMDKSPHKPTGYRFEDVVFNRTIVVPETSMGAETQFRMRKSEGLNADLSPCYDFRLYVYDHGEWTECCRGAITIEHDNSDRQLDHIVLEEHKNRSSANLSAVEHDKFYSNLQSAGLNYGPVFQITDDISYGSENECLGRIDLQTWTDLIEESGQSPCFIHPAALDCIIQVAFLGITQGAEITIPTIVPTGINEFWISQDILQEPITLVSAKSFHSSARTYTADYISLGSETERPLLLGDMTFTSIEATTTSLPVFKEVETPISLYHVEWKPDVNLLGPQSELFKPDPELIPQSEESIRLTEYACYLAMAEVLEAVDSSTNAIDLGGSATHIQKYVAWMRHEAKLINTSDEWKKWISALTPAAASQEQLWETVSSFGPEGNLIVKLCKQLLPIVKEEVDALQILFADETLSDYYKLENPPQEVTKGIQKYVDCLAHGNPSLHVIEIGAGTGGMTDYILRIIGNRKQGTEADTARFSEYVFTDISPAFFKASKEKFDRHGIVCKTLDIEREPADQGFETEAYDLVVASNVLHATKDLSLTLGNVRKLLKPGGKLLMVEGISPNLLRTSFIFGCLPGWWLSTEPYREWGPLVPASRWDELLRANNFSGVELIVDGADKTNCLSSGVITTACSPKKSNGETNSSASDILIVRNKNSVIQDHLTTSIQEVCQAAGLTATVTEATEIQNPSGAIAILLQTLDDFIFHNIDETNYQSLKNVLANVKNVLWVVKRSTSGSDSLEQEAVLGLGRSLMSETEGLNIVTLGLEGVDSTSRASKQVWTVLQRYFLSPLSNVQGEEVVEVDSSLCVSRVLPAKQITDEIWAMKNAKVAAANLNDLGNSILGSDEVEVAITVAAILAANELGKPSSLSPRIHEIMGVITQTGSNVQQIQSLQAGDAVMAILPNATTMKTTRVTTQPRVRCPASLIYRIPEGNLNDKKVPPLPLDFMIAYDTLDNCARIHAGESIVICDGSSALGQAAIQIAQYLKAEVFVYFKNVKDSDEIGDLYQIPDSHRLRLSKKGSVLTEQVKNLTSGRGVDILFNPVMRERKSQVLWDCIALYGRVVEVNMHDNSRSPRKQSLSFKHNIIYSRVDISELLYTPKRLAALLPKIMSLMEQKIIAPTQPLFILDPAESEKPSVDTVSPAAQHKKLVVSFGSTSSEPNTALFDSTASYLISGGLGGLGKSIAKWMVSHGARYLILLGRQGQESPGAKPFLDDFEAMGVSVFAPKCDISKDEVVGKVIEEAQRVMPPIKGYIQASMVLKSAMFAKMSLEQWTDTLQAKVQGSLNIERHLDATSDSTKLDFTIFLSSVCGIIGASGQSNYAFGCAFQDALARLKASSSTRRQKAISIDLGIVEGVGYTAEHQGTGAFMQSLGLQPIPEDYLLSMLEYFCDPKREIREARYAQVVAGIMTREEMQKRGIIRSRFYSRPLWRHLQQQQQQQRNNAMQPPTGPTTNSKRSSTRKKKPVAKLSTEPVIDHLHITDDNEAAASTPLANHQDRNQDNGGAATISRAICERLSDLLAIGVEDIDPVKPLHMYGVDSLVAMELRGWFKEALQKDVAVFDIMSNRPIEVLAAEVASS